MKDIITKTIGLAVAIVVVALLVVEQGWAISVLWGWFLVPLGAPAIGIAAAVGIAVLATAFRGRGKKPEDDSWFLLRTAMHPLFCVGIGWIAKQYI